MKALKIAAILLAALISAIYVAAEVEVINITLKDGTVEQHKISDIDQIIFEDHLILNALPVPENVQAAAGEGVVNITWSAVVGADDYAVYRTADGITYLQIGTTSSTSYIDDTPLVGSNSYAVQAFGPDEHMSPKSTATDPVVKLAAPANVAGEQTSGSVALTWDVVTGATSYTIFRSADGSTFAQIGTSATNSFSDTHPKIGDNYYRVVASASGCLSSNMSESSEAVEVTAQEEIGTHDYVDLGLPSGTLWATCNIGAENPGDYGDYYAWGDNLLNPDTNGEYYNYTYAQLASAGLIDDDGNITSQYDIATINLGGDWRMPTKEESEELVDNCTWTLATQNGHTGALVTGPNGNSIFLPESGHYMSNLRNAGEYGNYWCATASTDAKKCWSIYVDPDGQISSRVQTMWRNWGHSIRPVKSGTPPTPVNHDSVDLGLPSGLLWATCNIGASTPTDCGGFYAWGETQPRTSFTQNESTWYSTMMGSLISQGVIDANYQLTPAHDAAAVNWGGDWRMPTEAEVQELLNNCSWQWDYQDDRFGYTVTGPSGNSIFLPCYGQYYNTTLENDNSVFHIWTSTLFDDGYAKYLSGGRFGNFQERSTGNGRICNGLNIRPVKTGSATPPTPTLAATESVQGVVSGQTISVSWSAVTDATSYKVFRSTDGTNFTQIGTSDTNSFTDNAPNEGSNYYKVQALGANDLESELSAASAAVTYTAPIVNHDYVDLGLPSGTLWATCNVGASTPAESGGFYSWGETQPKTSFNQDQSAWYSLSMETLLSQGVIDANYQLTPAHDAAKVNWGGDWRLPTQAEVQELIDNCTWEWSSQGDRNGYTVTGPSGSSIFFPCYGYYYSTSPVNDNAFFYIWTSKCDGDYNSINLNGGRNSRTGLLLKTVSSFSQSNGHNIRPVKSNNVAE